MQIKIKKKEHENKRIDITIPLIEPSFSRSQIQKLIKEKKILVNGREIKANYLLKINDTIDINFSLNNTLEKENIPLDIVYEDDYLLVINKQRGLVVHPGNGNKNHTLVNALLYRENKLSSIDEARPGIVHRIDKDTSGLLVVAKDNITHRALSKQLENHTMHREYYALVKGIIKEDKGTIIAPIGRDNNNPIKMAVNIKNGKEAVSYFKVIKRLNDATLVEVKLEHGRTHQIRVHFNYIKHPVIGDPLYGKDNCLKIKDGQILHAYKISFLHPKTNKIKTFKLPLPKYFEDAINIYKN